MIDQAVVFGRYQNLVGTMQSPESGGCADQSCDDRPSDDRPSDDRPADVAVIFLTAGMLHHAGPYRLHVDLARTLASDGICSLRFDLSGIGESLGVGAAGRSIDRAADEVSQAMDFLSAELGIQKFVLFGLCSGADDSVHAALNDDRVVGVVAMDGCGYATPRFYWNRMLTHYLPRIVSPSKWAQFVTRKFAGQTMPASLQAGTDVREFPDRDQATIEFSQLVDRGVQMHFVYTGGIAYYYNYAKQFWDMFSDVNWKDQATTTYFAKMDHVGLLCDDRERLTADLCQAIRKIVGDTRSHTNVSLDAETGSSASVGKWPVLMPITTSTVQTPVQG